ncbi:MAG TPA: helix-turn-helix domain-containing protein [Pyrinomonadaceae bacterium]|jgi:excisionase family DNA binding protein|nr:helix-turn-helix domain-containing protein [Pyrinomonadaceae bacterium]
MEESSPHTDRREEFLTARQLAVLLQVSESTVRRLAREGRIPSIRLTPRLLRFHLSSVLSALDGAQTKTRTRRATPQQAADDTQLSFEDLM